ncbi:hypothetical protein MVEN_00751900 [Mycena venus]|uniref:Transmembrane protein n=1 Tax=Mycena venus TaxID=2733690 RepID=A0A8H6YL28_9AGAR|nr:hypothetical protein MVEN_00751900 [Mycena venus]
MANSYKSAGPVSTFLSSLSLPDLNSATHLLLSATMHCASAVVFALFFTSLVAAAPVTPLASSASVSDIATQTTAAANMAVPAGPAGDILSAVAMAEQSEIYSHVPEVHSSAEKIRRRSFRRRHP